MANAFTDKLRRFSSLSEADWAGVEALCSPAKAFAAGKSLLPEDSLSKTLHIVLDGWAARYRILPDGRRQFPALLLPGDVCDLDRLLMERLRSGLMTLTPCQMTEVPLDGLHALFDSRPGLRTAFWWLTCVENSIASEWAVCLGRRSALERVAHLFCELKVRIEAYLPASSDVFTLPITQEQLGDTVGLSIVHVNRTLQTLRQKGLVTLREHRLTILDHEALAQLCDFHAGYLHLEQGAARHLIPN